MRREQSLELVCISPLIRSLQRATDYGTRYSGGGGGGGSFIQLS